MNNLILFLAINMLTLSAIGQYFGYHEETNFETNLQLVRIDNSLPNNIWQVGTPQKLLFYSAYSLPNAMVTDTINYYPPANYSSFYISIKDLQWFEGSPSQLSFMHKYETQSNKDGGYIDVSYDGGENWLNIIYDSTMFNCTWTPGFGCYGYNFYSDSDTLHNGFNGFSGSSGGWMQSMFVWIYCLGVDFEYPDSMMIRFNFISDDQQDDKEGWMIDNIVLHSDICGGFIEDKMTHNYSASIYPNPVNDESKLLINGVFRKEYNLAIFDTYGRKLHSQWGATHEISIGEMELSPGIYFYRLLFDDNVILTGKFLIK